MHQTSKSRLIGNNLLLDKNRLRKDEFLGEAVINLPKDDEQESITLPLTGEGTAGNVTVEFFPSDKEEYTNCTK